MVGPLPPLKLQEIIHSTSPSKTQIRRVITLKVQISFPSQISIRCAPNHPTRILTQPLRLRLTSERSSLSRVSPSSRKSLFHRSDIWAEGHVSQIPGIASLLVHGRDRVRAVGVRRKTQSPRQRAHIKVIRGQLEQLWEW